MSAVRDHLIERRVLAHYWLWLAFTTVHVKEASRHRETVRALEALDWSHRR